MTNQERRIADLTEQLDKANREINRLVLENNEQDFEIHRLKKLVNIISDERDSLINDLDEDDNVSTLVYSFDGTGMRDIIEKIEKIGREGLKCKAFENLFEDPKPKAARRVIGNYVVVQSKRSLEIVDCDIRRDAGYTDYNVYDEHYKDICEHMGKSVVDSNRFAHKIITTPEGDRYFFTPAASAEDALQTYLKKREEKA